jgi:hypothetical protein
MRPDRDVIAPPVAPAQLVLRFALELGALVAIGAGAGRLAPPDLAIVAWVGAIALVAVVWGTFAVRGDPTRSGKAPVPVPGAVRLLLELAVFGAGAASLALQGRWVLCGGFVVLLVVHHLGTVPRLRWLLRQ